ncbi:hypothetical protein [Vibrio parahaemolyticus]|uniref:hypothetical protein n=1 Tax=Vibrio parahaemolyticus TaxID=670 RepID=UPI001E5E36B3|nr:hypothetical protein [Vibrio parahaemolyticus]EIT7137987.1 hypothetical protein [Vibrio parahaemolyticus]MCD2149348.1 hypothetical protein [Vibrio parahaemolyticus]HCJ4665634.1 hypothetical protein [Vibrio parahaemolyticus]
MCNPQLSERAKEIRSLISSLDENLDLCKKISRTDHQMANMVKDILSSVFEDAENTKDSKEKLINKIDYDEYKLIINIFLHIFANVNLDNKKIEISESGLKLLLNAALIFSKEAPKYNYRSIMDSDLNASR